MDKIELKPIGTIYSPFEYGDPMPIQSTKGRDVEGYIEILPQYEEGLKDLDGFSHIILFFYLHLNDTVKLQTIPFVDHVVRGVFATRSPSRPNHLGMSIVRLERIEGNRIYIKDLDIINGTPLLDIKPYLNNVNKQDPIRLGWYEAYKDDQTKCHD